MEGLRIVIEETAPRLEVSQCLRRELHGGRGTLHLTLTHRQQKSRSSHRPRLQCFGLNSCSPNFNFQWIENLFKAKKKTGYSSNFLIVHWFHPFRGLPVLIEHGFHLSRGLPVLFSPDYLFIYMLKYWLFFLSKRNLRKNQDHKNHTGGANLSKMSALVAHMKSYSTLYNSTAPE